VARTELIRVHDSGATVGPESAVLESQVLESEVFDNQSTGDELFSALTVSLTPGTAVIPNREQADARDAEPPKIVRSGDPDDRSGDIIQGRYQLVRQLGKGGMGTVYIARHTLLPKTFAVKLLNARYAKRPDIAERFLQEAHAVSLINHDNVVGVIDFGRESDDAPFLVMEHLSGESLGAVCKREAPLAWPRVQHIMSQLCRALQAAHAVGVVHRDVKPDNILRVTRHDDPDFIKVLDFGLAKLQVSGGVRLTATGMVLGTPDYMSPEQARGLPSDHRTDIYAAGIMMYELLCKRVPFSATTFAEMRQKHLLEPPQPPSKWQAWITEEIDAIVLCALAKDPAHRFASMAEMGAAIEAVGTGKSVVPLLERQTLPLHAGTILAQRSVIDEPRRARPEASSGASTIAIPGTRARGSDLPVAPTSHPSQSSEPSKPTPPRKHAVLGIVLIASALVVGGVAALFATGSLDGLMGRPDPSAATEPVPAPAPVPVSAHMLLQFETNVPVVVTDLEGRTPFGEQPTRSVSMPRSEQPMRLVLRADGYRDLHVVVTPDHDQIFSAHLEPAPVPEPEPASGTPDPDAAAEPSGPSGPSGPSIEPESPTRERPRTKKPPTEQAEPPAEPEPEPEHSFSPEIRDPFGKAQPK
jgi:serine/threonine protein kinase